MRLLSGLLAFGLWAAPAAKLKITPENPLLFGQGSRQRLVVTAEYPDGTAREVTAEAASNPMPKDKDTRHVVLIIGYNKDTNEIAFSDSWGDDYKERWITLQEAQFVSDDRFYVIGF